MLLDIDGEVTTINNKDLNDTQSSQKLSHQEIEQLKKELLKGEKNSEVSIFHFNFNTYLIIKSFILMNFYFIVFFFIIIKFIILK